MSTDNRTSSQYSLSFLDVIACAFGAIVLLVLILPIGEDATEKPESVDLSATGRLYFLIDTVTEEVETLTSQLSTNQKLLSDIESETVSIEQATEEVTEAVQSTQSQLESLRGQQQTLETTVAILQEPVPQTPEPLEVESELSGIPVDSEYVVFVVDTSGSMQSIWGHVIEEVKRFWNLYPNVKGFQFMNDNGHYLSRIGAGRWIPDNFVARQAALKKLDGWMSFSNSSPVEGILQAVKDLYSDDRKMAIVVVGDEYQGGSFQYFFDDLEKSINSRSVKEENLRIHALGFYNMVGGSGNNFAILARELTHRYHGAFVGIEEAGFFGSNTSPSILPSVPLPVPLPNLGF